MEGSSVFGVVWNIALRSWPREDNIQKAITGWLTLLFPCLRLTDEKKIYINQNIDGFNRQWDILVLFPGLIPMKN